ncbi:DUF4177 domain-containing protein [Novilysobacter selenitireducens]|uniref:DUF4177 domain-containing protein n=1 Tax=Novilysobacter selenitireducens TaxID=2872639 RepID=A0ABS7T763_9GAMM|nr:DUF4177 domain-containing protein [Lysobacter selenitireducens]MBZ4039676.1 DUF4177 domain-containing protein [Lysobacter selenitireducens]
MSERWMYEVVEVKPGIMGGFKTEVMQEALNRMGRQGWELVNVVLTGPMMPALAVFKKPA